MMKNIKTKLSNYVYNYESKIVFLLSSIVVIRLFYFINKFSVNVIYHDQWDFYTPLFENYSFWQLFTWEHGPHRQGIGMIVTSFLANMNSWDTRIDAYAVGALMFIAFCIAIHLKYRLFKKIELSDIIITMLFFTLFQYEIFTVVPNLSYAAFPILMLMLYCTGILIENYNVRYIVLLFLNFLLIYTGFGFFVGPITITLILIDLYQSKLKKERFRFLIFYLFLAIASLSSFFISHNYDTANPSFGFSVSYFLQYPIFVSLMFATYLGWHTSIVGQLVAILVGTLILSLVILVWLRCIKVIIRDAYSNRTILIIGVLLSFTLLFCLSTAIGRVQLGVESAQANRYVTFMIPAFFAIYLYLISIRKTIFLKYILLLFFLSSTAGSLPISKVNNLGYKTYNEKKIWVECYLQHESTKKCYEITKNEHFYIMEYPDIDKKLAFLKKHKLNLYLQK